MPAKPPPTIKPRLLPGTGFVTGGFSCGKDLVRTVVMDVPTVFRASRPISIDTAGLRPILGSRCVALNDHASSCWRGRYALEWHAREDIPKVVCHDDQKCPPYKKSCAERLLR